MTHERIFHFKQFSLRHSESAMKIGVDGVLLGAWINLQDTSSLLDVGCGCGLIAIMSTQRNPHLSAIGIDIDEKAVNEANANAALSPWHSRLEFKSLDFSDIIRIGGRFDMIVSNPPFFLSGLSNPVTEREISRHAFRLSPQNLIKHGRELLTEQGRLAMITPYSQLGDLQQAAIESGMALERMTEVITVEGKQPKRLLSEWTHETNNPTFIHDVLTIEIGQYGQRVYSEEYIRLCSPFYLRI